MLFINKPILWTDADVIVVPVRCDDEIPDHSLHEAACSALPLKYLDRHLSSVRNKRIVPGEPMVFYVPEGPWVGRWVIDIPVDSKMIAGTFMQAIAKVMDICKRMDADTIAVSLECKEVPFADTIQEYMWEWWERKYAEQVEEKQEAGRKVSSARMRPEVEFYTSDEWGYQVDVEVVPA